MQITVENNESYMKENRKNISNVPNLRFPQFAGEWEKAVLDDLGDFTGGGTPTSSNIDYWKGTIPWISSSDLEEENISKINISRYITKDAILNSATKLCYAPVIAIVTRVGVGKIAYSKENICTSQDFTNITNLKCDGLFLSYLLSKILKKKAGEAQGTSIKGITSKEIKLIKLHIPSLTEQQKIASLLSLIDERITTQSKIIEGLKELKASLSKQLFSRKLQFKDEGGKDFPEWVEKKLEYAVSQFIVPMRDKPQDLTGDIPWCRIEDFNGKHLYTSKSGQGVDISTVKEMSLKIYPIDTLLVSCSANLGVCAITKKELVTNQTFIGLVPDKTKIDVEYLYYIMTLSSIKLNTLSSGTTISYLSREEFEKFKIPYPCLQEQKKIANFLSNIDSKIEVETKTFELQKRQKQYLLRQMFI